MTFIVLFVLLTSTSICFSKHIEKGEQVRAQLYYESLCPDCVEFYQTVYLMSQKLGSSVDIQTYPFGNAEFTDTSQTEVECQHGEDECYGNKLHACAIDQLKDPKKYLKFNACVIAKSSTDTAVDECGQSQEVNSESIKNCAKGQKGQDLLIQAGKETYKARPGQRYTPYTLLNGKEYPIETDKDFIKYVCNMFTNPPPACKQV